MGLKEIEDYKIPDCRDYPGNKMTWLPEAPRSVLLVHDMQNYFLRFFRTDSMQAELIRSVRILTDSCRKIGVPVIFSGQPGRQSVESRGLLTDFWGKGIGTTEGERSVAEGVGKEAGDLELIKHRYSAFYETELKAWMERENRDQMFLCGIYGHIGCMMTAVDAFMNDIQCFFVGDAMGDLSLSEHQMALRYVSSRCGKVVSYQNLEVVS